MSSHDLKVGQFLVENQIITEHQLNDALQLQKDNPDKRVGEILVTQGVLSKEQVIMAIEMYMISTDHNVSMVDEWLDQDEIDMLMVKLQENPGK
ncbi:MAG: hypothetical protein JW982_00570 [Spirochaetes bacterium]|nr:hypothetical protein [Spirochaetota bacterium]